MPFIDTSPIVGANGSPRTIFPFKLRSGTSSPPQQVESSMVESSEHKRKKSASKMFKPSSPDVECGASLKSPPHKNGGSKLKFPRLSMKVRAMLSEPLPVWSRMKSFSFRRPAGATSSSNDKASADHQMKHDVDVKTGKLRPFSIDATTSTVQAKDFAFLSSSSRARPFSMDAATLLRSDNHALAPPLPRGRPWNHSTPTDASFPGVTPVGIAGRPIRTYNIRRKPVPRLEDFDDVDQVANNEGKAPEGSVKDTVDLGKDFSLRPPSPLPAEVLPLPIATGVVAPSLCTVNEEQEECTNTAHDDNDIEMQEAEDYKRIVSLARLKEQATRFNSPRPSSSSGHLTGLSPPPPHPRQPGAATSSNHSSDNACLPSPLLQGLGLTMLNTSGTFGGGAESSAPPTPRSDASSNSSLLTISPCSSGETAEPLTPVDGRDTLPHEEHWAVDQSEDMIVDMTQEEEDEDEDVFDLPLRWLEMGEGQVV